MKPWIKRTHQAVELIGAALDEIARRTRERARTLTGAVHARASVPTADRLAPVDRAVRADVGGQALARAGPVAGAAVAARVVGLAERGCARRADERRRTRAGEGVDEVVAGSAVQTRVARTLIDVHRTVGT